MKEESSKRLNLKEYEKSSGKKSYPVLRTLMLAPLNEKLA